MSATEDVPNTRPTHFIHPRTCPKCQAPWDFESQRDWKCQYCGYTPPEAKENWDIIWGILLLIVFVAFGFGIIAMEKSHDRTESAPATAYVGSAPQLGLGIGAN